MMLRSDKEKVILELRSDIEKANAIFITNIIGITSNESVNIRKELRKVGGTIRVSRNTLLKKASAGTKFEKIVEELNGPNAFAFAFDDVSAVAKVLYEASKNLEVIKFKGGIFGNSPLTSADIESLAKLPSRDQMLATLLATFNAPASAFVRCLDAIRVQKESASP